MAIRYLKKDLNSSDDLHRNCLIEYLDEKEKLTGKLDSVR